MEKSSSKITNLSGSELEGLLETILENKDYQFIERNKFLLATHCLEQKFYTKQMIIGESIYSTPDYKHILNADFVIFNPVGKEKYIIIECKSQTSVGSVDEKYPYLNENIKTQYPYKTIIILDAPAAKKGAKDWLKKQEAYNHNLLYVFLDFSKFRIWAIKNF